MANKKTKNNMTQLKEDLNKVEGKHILLTVRFE